MISVTLDLLFWKCISPFWTKQCPKFITLFVGGKCKGKARSNWFSVVGCKILQMPSRECLLAVSVGAYINLFMKHNSTSFLMRGRGGGWRLPDGICQEELGSCFLRYVFVLFVIQKDKSENYPSTCAPPWTLIILKVLCSIFPTPQIWANDFGYFGSEPASGEKSHIPVSWSFQNPHFDLILYSWHTTSLIFRIANRDQWQCFPSFW